MAKASVQRPFRGHTLGFLGRIVHFLASLQVAVVLLAGCAIVLAAATLLEWRWGTEVAHFVIYRAWWFHLLVVLLCLSVLLSALVRLPWKRHHLGFLITHFGILILLAGALLSLWFGVDAQLPVFEGQTGHRAFAQESQIVLTVASWGESSRSSPEQGAVRGVTNVGPHITEGESNAPQWRVIRIPFHPGPFHWRDYDRWPIRLLGLWARPGSTLFDDGAIRLEVVDYYRDADVVPAPALRLGVRTRGGQWETREFRISGVADLQIPHRSFALGSRQELPSGQRIVFSVASSRAEGEAFLKLFPSAELPPSGEVVLFHRGAIFRIPVDKLTKDEEALFEAARLHVRLSQSNPRFHGVVLDLSPAESVQAAHPVSRRLILFADLAEFNRHDDFYGVYGAYWDGRDSGTPTAESSSAEGKPGEGSAGQQGSGQGGLSQPGRPRVDILQTVEGSLYYRTCLRGKVLESGVLPPDGSPVRVFAGLPEELELRLEEWANMDRPGELLRPVPLQSAAARKFKRPFVRVRLTVDGWLEEFWLEEQPASPFLHEEAEQKRWWVAGQGRSVAVEFLPKTFELGFAVRLHEFERRLEPGSQHPASYGSRVDIVDRADPERVIFHNVWITMNRPLTVRDPASGYVYRIYQEAYRGPFQPGDALFERVVQGREPRQQLFLSWLTISYDPGRGLKYLGALLTVVGIVITFYMRGYFRAGSLPQERDAGSRPAAGAAGGSTALAGASHGFPPESRAVDDGIRPA